MRPATEKGFGRRLAFAGIILCLFLTGCYFQPGRFSADFRISGDGRFTYRYVGELIFAFPERAAASAGIPAIATCHDADTGTETPCSEKELADRRTRAQLEYIARQRDAAELAELTGYNPYDEAANEALARRVERIEGWNSVEYRGNGIFEVDYSASGTLDRDFVFPILPDAQISVPIIGARRIKGNRVEIEAPGFASGPLRAMLIKANGSASDEDDMPLFNRAYGTFTVSTDAQFVDSNGEIVRVAGSNGSEGRWQTVSWTVRGSRSERPSALIALSR